MGDLFIAFRRTSGAIICSTSYSWRFMSAQKLLYAQTVIIGGLYGLGSHHTAQTSLAKGSKLWLLAEYIAHFLLFIFMLYFFCFYVLFFFIHVSVCYDRFCVLLVHFYVVLV